MVHYQSLLKAPTLTMIAGLRAITTAFAIGLALVPIVVKPVSAECLYLDQWPSFEIVAPVAETVIVGKVVEDRTPDMQGGRLGHFGLLVTGVYRGKVVPGSIVDIEYLPPSPPPALCPTYLRPMLGEVLAIAIGAPGPDGSILNSAAWLKGEPDEMMQGLGKITRAELQAMFDLPATDAVSPRSVTLDMTARWVFVSVLALAGGLVALQRAGQRDPSK